MHQFLIFHLLLPLLQLVVGVGVEVELQWPQSELLHWLGTLTAVGKQALVWLLALVNWQETVTYHPGQHDVANSVVLMALQ